ncbi:MAG: rhodanese-like domain-containing protein [Gammaproteobacteria bacterium]|nr:rhodanese-like domain-containing protein [Gammaproteobacteria bacterium]
MQQFVEFVGNHPFLWMAFAAVLGMIIFTEYSRVASGVTGLSPFAATQLLNKGDALVVDVRDEKEFKAGHVLNARNLPVSSLDKRLVEIDKFKEKNVVLYCDNGMRASRAASKMKKNGFTQLHTITGGVGAWEKANLPLVSK